MKLKFAATLAAAALSVGLSATSSKAFLGFEPCETCGVALEAPLPEGVFAADNEAYGRRDRTPNINDARSGGGAATPPNGVNVGVNIPAVIWSTPVTFYNTRLELFYAAPFVHLDGPQQNGNSGRVNEVNEAFGPILAHDFGRGFSAGLLLLVRPAITSGATNNTSTYADMRFGVAYTANGFDINAALGYTGTLGRRDGSAQFGGPAFINGQVIRGNAEALDIDFTATKKFGKFEAGFVGFAQTDIQDALSNLHTYALGNGRIGTYYGRQGAVGVGGLIGYDFGRFTVQGYATREVAERNQGSKETRGFIRIVLPLYIAPAAPVSPVIARY